MHTGPIGTGSALAKLLIRPQIVSPRRKRRRPVKRRPTYGRYR